MSVRCRGSIGIEGVSTTQQIERETERTGRTVPRADLLHTHAPRPES